MSTFSKSLEIKNRLFQGFSSFNQLKHVHARLLRFGLDQDHYLLNLFLHCSFNFRDINYTRLVFDQTREPNVHLWNMMIRGFVSKYCFSDAIEFYGLMRKEGFLPQNFTYPFVLKACLRLSHFQLGVKIHNTVVKGGFDCDEFVMTSLVRLYANCGRVEDALKLFEDIPDKNVASWNAIISGFVEAGRSKEAINVLLRMLEIGLRPDSFTLVQVLSACIQSGDLNSGELIHRYITEIGMGSNVFVATSLLDMYVKFGDMEKARYIFDGMSEKTIVSWNTMIQGYASNVLPKEALDLFFQMQSENLEPDCYSMVGFLSACATLGALELGNWARSLMDENQFLCNPVLGTALIDMYAKCGSMAQAWNVFIGMKKKDLVVWNAVISGLSMNGHVRTAFGVFGRLEKSGIQPNGNTFVGLLCGCTHAGLVDEGRRYFNSINRVFSLTPTSEHYGCMVDLLSRAGLLDEAHQLIKSMPMEATAVVWGSLLSGSRLHQDFQFVEHALKQLIELEPWNSGNYVLLSNMYLASHRWDEASKIRANMSARRIRKVKGYSWTEVEGVVHSFFAGDESHPLSQKIYAKLHELGKALKAAGHIPRTDFVLFDIEEGEKEHSLGYHSEKLAVAFGLISTSSKDVIRIAKNLRVCGDCHEALKLISKITSREIIVRDNNRFHYFSDGLCSCKDYW